MKIYFIDRRHGGGYDEYYGFVVIADSEKEAKEIVINKRGSEFLDLDLDKNFTVMEIGESTLASGIVMEDFHAG